MRIVKELIKRILRGFGYELTRSERIENHGSSTLPFGQRFIRHIIDSRFDIVFDVGANAGQYGALLRKMGYRGRIISFEPLPGPFAALKEMAEKDGNWMVNNCALGSVSGEALINVSKNSVSSSFLAVEPASLSIEPAIGYIGQQKVRVEILDKFFDECVKEGERVFLKLDVQGFEAEAIKGAAENLRKIFAIQMEMSVVPIYKQEKLMCEMIGFLKSHGFALFDLQEAFSDQVSGRLLQVDGLFFRESIL